MIKKPQKNLSLTITFYFSIITLITNFSLITAFFFLVRDELAIKDKNIAAIRFNEIAQILKYSGLENLAYQIKNNKLVEQEYLMVIVKKNDEELLRLMPLDLDNFDIEDIESTITDLYLLKKYTTIRPKFLFEENIEVYAGSVDAYHLIVGYRTDLSEDFLEHYYRLSFIITIIAAVSSIILGFILAKRSLAPIRDLIAVVKLIEKGSLNTLNVTSKSSSKSQDELSELIRLFNRMIIQINKLINSLQTSLDAIAHDLRTPLTHISNKLQFFANTPQKTISQEAIGELLEETNDIAAMINSLLEINHVGHPDIVDINLLELIKETIDIYEYIALDKNVTIDINCSPEITIPCDRIKTKRLLANLIDNALKYSKPIKSKSESKSESEKSRIEIRCLKNEHTLTIEVYDNGHGIAPDDLDKIWQRLYRADSSRTTQGMGLGLSLVKTIVDAHEWEINVKSELELGTVFTITIPLN